MKDNARYGLLILSGPAKYEVEGYRPHSLEKLVEYAGLVGKEIEE